MPRPRDECSSSESSIDYDEDFQECREEMIEGGRQIIPGRHDDNEVYEEIMEEDITRETSIDHGRGFGSNRGNSGTHPARSMLSNDGAEVVEEDLFVAKKKHSRTPMQRGEKKAEHRSQLIEEEIDVEIERHPSRSESKVSTGGAGDDRNDDEDKMMLEEYSDDEDLADVQTTESIFTKPKKSAAPVGASITIDTALKLRHLVFGSDHLQAFSPEWANQSFFFNPAANLHYGLVQFQGGPCGVLAAVQAYILKYLLFTLSDNPYRQWNNPSPFECEDALVFALSEILWRAGAGQGATVALRSTVRGEGPALRTANYRPDGLTESLRLYELTSRDALQQFLKASLTQFTTRDSPGVVLLVYSLLLSRGLERTERDMDSQMGGGGEGSAQALVGNHGYASQELVNLLLVGQAVSNVFDNSMDMGGDMVLYGLGRQAPVGFLTLFETYGHVRVGSNFKVPEVPVWVICSESHYSVLFSSQQQLVREDKPPPQFDLFYYDGLAQLQDLIKLSISHASEDDPLSDCEQGRCKQDRGKDCGCAIPPIELVIRTKWERARVNWNGSEPML